MTGSSNPGAVRTPPRTRFIDAFAIGLSFAWLAGLVHFGETVVARHVLHELVWVSRDFQWMAPLAYGLVILPVVLILSLLYAALGTPWLLRLTIFASAIIAGFGVLLPYSQIARIASLVLAAGAAFQLARGELARAVPRYRRFAFVGALVIAALAGLMPWWRGHQSRQALQGLPVAPSGATNVLLIILDTVRAASLSLYGNPEPTTPHLEQWAREGAVFSETYAVAPWTLPSHASLFTGRYAGELSADWKTPLGNSDSTLAELFARRGYATGAFMANMHYTSWDAGLDRGFATYLDYRTSWWQLVRSSAWTQTAMFDQLRSARSIAAVISALVHPDLSIDMKHTFDRKLGTEVTTQFLAWQRTVGVRPFFAVLNYFDAHQPYYAPVAYQHFPRSGGTARYKAAIAYLDHNIDSILVELKQRGQLEHTLVVVTSDHGELFNEHGLSGHAHNLYRNVLRVPLLLRLPAAVPQGVRIPTTVSLRDVPATIIDLAGLPGAHVPGASLRATWTDSSASRSPALSEVSHAPNVSPTYPTAKGPMKSLTADAIHYIRNGDRREEFFDMRADTSESTNLVASRADEVVRWRARVDSVLAARTRPH
ncbi:MAG: sulfatase-like hydrolase/transferase [Gemmatimonadaceae bacterium]